LALSSLLRIALMVTLSHLLTSPFTYTLVSRLTTQDYRWLKWHFNSADDLIFWSLVTIQPLYFVGGLIVFKTYGFSIHTFQSAYVAIIANIIAVNITTVLFMYLKVGEIPNKYGWMALFFALLAGLFNVFAANQR